MDENRYDTYWDQTAENNNEEEEEYDKGYNYEPEVDNEEEKLPQAFSEDLGDLKLGDTMQPTFMQDDKIEWDRSEYDICIVEIVKQGHTSYKIKGVDKNGELDICRRYKEFYALRNVMRKRWVGFYIPGIPPKKPIGNKEDIVVKERWYLLNRFLQEVSKIPHLWESEEMGIFLRPKMDVEKNLNLLGKMTSEQILERISTYCGVDYLAATSTQNKYKDVLRDFVGSSKDLFKFLNNFKEYAKKLEQIRKLKLLADAKLGGFLAKYEESTVALYGISDFTNNRVVSNTDNDAVRSTLDGVPKTVDNPYSVFKHWVKEEIIDFHALVEAISQKNLLEGMKNKAESKKRSSQSELDKLNAGKKTFKSFFKSASQKATQITTLTQTIAQCDVDIENLEKAIVHVEMYLGDTALPVFKKKKVSAYYSTLKDLAGKEQTNCQNLLESWKVVYNAFSEKLQ